MQRLPSQGGDELLVTSQRSPDLLAGVGIPQADGSAFVTGANLATETYSKLLVRFSNQQMTNSTTTKNED